MWTPQQWYEEASAEAAADAGYIREIAELYLRIYAEQRPGSSRGEIVAELARTNRERLEALPDLHTYPELRGMQDLIAAQWRGHRDGAGLDDDQHAAYCDGLYCYQRAARNPAPGMPGCTTVFFPDSDLGPLLAKNTDTRLDQPMKMPVWSEGVLNEHLVCNGASCGIWCDETSPEVFPVPVLRLVARYCRSTAEAVELLTRYKLFWGPVNYCIADHSGDVAMIEKSSCRIGARRSEDGFGFVTAMTMEEPEMNAYLADRRATSLKARALPEECDDAAYWREADHRRRLLNELVAEAKAKPTFEGLRQIMHWRDGRGRVCYRGEPLRPGGPGCEYTLRTAIWILREGRIAWWLGDADTEVSDSRQPDAHVDEAVRW